MKRCAVVALMASLGFSTEVWADTPCGAEAKATRGKHFPSLKPPTDPGAIKHMEAGNARHREGIKRASVVATRGEAAAEFKAAIDEYVAAAMISPSPAILMNLAQTYRAAGDYSQAIEQYRLFLDRAKPERALRKLVECHIDAMSAELAKAAASAPPQGPISSDAPAADATTDTTADATRPPNAAATPDLPANPTSSVTGGRYTQAEFPSGSNPPWHADTIAWTVAGGGATVAGVGVFLLLDARSVRQDAAGEPRDNVRAELDAKADRRQTWGTISTLAGGAVLAAGIVKLAIGPDAPDTRRGVSLEPIAGGFALAGSF